MLPSVFESYRGEIDGELRGALAGCDSPMYDMLRYHLGWIDENGHPARGNAGKALRPTLCLLACESVGGDRTVALPAAASLELIHNFSLIHDDIQDDDRERRHRPTVWSLWGKPQAINAGTAMRIVASLELSRLAETGLSPARLLRVHRLMDGACLRLIEGQYLDISYEGRTDIGVSEYLTMVEGKTAALIASSLEVGAMLGSESEAACSAFRSFGLNLGLAFQIQDDILGIWGDAAKTGKPVGSDILRRKKSFLIVIALETASAVVKARLRELYQAPVIGADATAEVLEILDRLQAMSEATKTAERFRDKGLAALREAPISHWGLSRLEEMALFLTGRDH